MGESCSIAWYTVMATRFPRSSRLAQLVGIAVDRMGDTADALADSAVLRLENLDTDLRPCAAAIAATKRAADMDTANSYLPFLGQEHLRRAAAAHVTRMSGVDYEWRRCCVISAGGLSGILNVLLATIEPGDEVILADPIYVGLLNRVRLTGGVPRLAPMIPSSDGWRLDRETFRTAAASPNARALLMMSPSMPTGAVLTRREWEAVAEACCARDLLLIYDAAMERILFDGREVLHPASLPGMADRTVTVGSASKELRMIGWRVGWVVGPAELIDDVGMVGISNVVSQVSIAMEAAAIALEASDSDVRAAAQWQRRRDLILRETRRHRAGDSAPWRLVLAARLQRPWTGRRVGLARYARARRDCGYPDDELGWAECVALSALRLRERAL